MSWQNFMSRDVELLKTGLLADATITCGERTWKVHKSIIYRSEWFDKAFNGNFEEAQTNNVNISADEFSPQLVDSVIWFIYSGVVNDIEKLNTNDSLVDACVRLWAIADFFVLKELQSEAINILEKYCEEKIKVLNLVDDDYGELNSVENDSVCVSDEEYDLLLKQLFRGVNTAYKQYPHSVPCQQILISLFHAARYVVFPSSEFSSGVSKAPSQFAQELFMAIIDGRKSKWVTHDDPGFNWEFVAQGRCTGCRMRLDDYRGPWAVDPSSNPEAPEWVLDVDWRCKPCLEKYGFDPVNKARKKR